MCCSFLAVGDRWAALYAENAAAEKEQRALKLHAEPEVHIRGFPFLTQLADNRVDRVDVTIPDMPAGRVSVAQVKGQVNGVRLLGDAPGSVDGAVLGRMNGDVLLDFDDLDRELGTPQVKFTAGGPHTVLAAGQLSVAGEKVKVRARAQLARAGEHGVGTTVDRMRLVVPDLFSYTPGDRGGLRLARPVAERIRDNARVAKALFGVAEVAERFGLCPGRAERVRESESELDRVTGGTDFTDRMMKVNMLDVLVEHPWLLQQIGIEPALLEGLKRIDQPELAEKLSLAMKLPDVPGDVRLRDVSVSKDGVRARLTGTDVPFGKAAEPPAPPPGRGRRDARRPAPVVDCPPWNPAFCTFSAPLPRPYSTLAASYATPRHRAGRCASD
ncbi:LmeA family phospholipid-binding protein [Streptomyces armeniacus]|uniref:LmeA family phospholipid-binding protein n=1 Tax=Streptomyces armeniacus TaxID=83291 RepID=UPI001FE2D36C|nr:DUF2993 domain-containing protein [Streptomyces armeniacus]